MTNIRGKTEQRVSAIIQVLRDTPNASFTYEELCAATGAHYDACLYILATLCEVDLVTRITEAHGPGRPKVRFCWAKVARGVGPRGRQRAASA